MLRITTLAQKRRPGMRDARRRRMNAEHLEDRLLLDARLVADINQTPLTRGSFPQDFVELGELVLFTAETRDGRELWRTDGTAAGTQQIVDLQPGPTSSAFSGLTVSDGYAYFQVTIENSLDRVRNELWRTDGTSEGTIRFLEDMTSLLAGNQFETFVVVGGDVYTSVQQTLIKISSDGETSEIQPIGGGFFYRGVANLTAFDESVFFASETLGVDGVTSARGVEIWISDFNSSRARLLKDIAPGPDSSNPSHLFATRDALFFFINPDGMFPQLWKTDGTDDGTRAVATLPQLPVAGMAESNGLLYFVVDDLEHGQELWRSDGTEDGTFLVKDIRAGADGSAPTGLFNFNETLFFTADDGMSGPELWASDGTAAGTVLVKDILSGPLGSAPADFAVLEGQLFFSAEDEEHGLELWKTDGTAAGTELAFDLIDGPASSIPIDIRAAGNLLYFAAQGIPSAGFEPWRSDGTLAGTISLGNLAVDGNDGSLPRAVTRVGETMFFTANDGVSGHELWKTDGTAAGTALVRDIVPGPAGADVVEMWNIDGTLYFSASDGVHGIELWTSDGTADGTRRVKDIEPGFGGSVPANLIVAGNVIYFSAYDSEHGEELWKTDGTEVGTQLVKDINPGLTGSYPRELANLDGRLVFVADDGNQNEIWRSDGTNAGTEVASDTRDHFSTVSPDIGSLVVVNGELFFLADLQLYKTAGTADSTVQLGAAGNNMVPYGDNLLFIFKTPRTAGKTVEFDTRLDEVPPMDEWLEFPNFHENDPQFTVLAERLFFNANGLGSSTMGDVEMWSYDPRNQDLRLVVGDNINPDGSPEPKELSIHNDLIFFVATGDRIGTEIWATNGTEAGTFPVADIAPGPPNSLPSQLTFLDDTLFVRADDGVAGTELWAIDLPSAVRFQENAMNVVEAAGFAEITLTRLGNTSSPLNVRVETVGGSATGSSAGTDYDFVDTPMTGTFAANETETTVALPIVNDNLREMGETIELAITNVNGGQIGAHFEMIVTLFDDALPGDLDFDGDLDLADLDALVFGIVNGPPPNEFFYYDLNNDGEADAADIGSWLVFAGEANLTSRQPYAHGDANLDGMVDTGDFDILLGHLFGTAPSWSMGDFNADGVTDGSDFNTWNDNKFTVQASAALPNSRTPRAAWTQPLVIAFDKLHAQDTKKVSAHKRRSRHDAALDAIKRVYDSPITSATIHKQIAPRSLRGGDAFNNGKDLEAGHLSAEVIDVVLAALVDELSSSGMAS